jgi:hypothetical protein
MESLIEVLQQAMAGYSGEALNGYSYLTSSENKQIFTVISVGDVRGERVVDTGLVARFEKDRIIIEHDGNDKPLVDALVSMGVARKQIVLAYAGESIGEAA